MPLTVFDVKGIPGNQRERIEAAVVAGGKHATGAYEGWIATDPFKGGVKVVITGPEGFQRGVAFALDEDAVVTPNGCGRRWRSSRSCGAGASPASWNQWHCSSYLTGP